MGKYGMLETCIRCGETIFREKIGSGEADGGYTTWDKFEPIPSNWYYSSELNGNLCPCCAPIFRKIMLEFIGCEDKLLYNLKNYNPYLVEKEE